MQVSVVVPAFNEEKLIASSLRSILAAMAAFAERGWPTELIVCDNNSTDRTAELARAEGARVVFEPVNQIARARNTGAAAACGDWLLFVDADSYPSRGLLADVAEAIARGDCLAGGSTVWLEGDYPIAALVNRLWNGISRIQRWAPGSFLFCEAAAFREAGGFNQELYVSEEIDLSRRLKRVARASGRRIVILHRHPLATSARKLQLYSAWEHLRFVVRTVFSLKRTLKDPKQCHTWYDGRR
jgi:glycosyltransferase involved in cell wall biosynthesis